MYMLIVDPKYTTIKINSMNEHLLRKTDDFGNLLLTGSFPFTVNATNGEEEVVLVADEIEIPVDDSEPEYELEEYNEEWF